MNEENQFRDWSAERAALQQRPGAQINSARYKTELCRPFEENGTCKYGDKCQFAHGFRELRSLSRHPKYKTEPCRTFHTIGFCPYGPRCHFIHNADERRPVPAVESRPVRELSAHQRDRPRLNHSLSLSGFSSHLRLESTVLDSPTSRTSASAFYEEMLSPSAGSRISSFFSPGQNLNALLAPLLVHASSDFARSRSTGACYLKRQSCACPLSPTYNLSHLQALRRLSKSPVFEPPPSPPDSLSDQESYASGSRSSSGSLSGSESPSLDEGRRLPIFRKLSISDD